MRLVCLSDTHGRHRRLEANGIDVPDGDVLIHAGDVQGVGNWGEVEDFNAWLGELPHTHKIVIAGNHDASFYHRRTEVREALTNATYLLDESIDINGLMIWGSPWTPRFFDWYFMGERGMEMAARWAKIPEETDILITHGPPQGYGDSVGIRNAGCEALAERLKALALKAHIFGHIHEGYGEYRHPNVERMVNVSTCTPRLKVANPPVVLDID